VRKHRVAVLTALLVGAGAMWAPITAQAAGPSTYYVGFGADGCSDTTTNSAVKPYCTIQPAVNAATVPGDTVVVAAGSYAPFKVTASGTAAAPITIKGVAQNGTAAKTSITTSNAVAVTITGASYVNVDGFSAFENANFSGIVVSKSSHVALDRDYVGQNYTPSTGAGISITGGSSDDTVSRAWAVAYSTSGGVYVDGGSGNVVTTSIVDDWDGPAIAMVDSPSSDVSSNEIGVACQAGIRLTAGSSSASVENNVGVYGGFSGSSTSPDCPTAAASQVDLLVDSSSTSGTSEGYNDFATGSTSIPDIYSWAGTGYASPAAFTAATGQGNHDLNSTDTADAVDSANSDAPGELSSDMYDNARVDDPNVPNAGSGTYAYYDRGPGETDDPLAVTFNQSNPTLMPVEQTGKFSATITDPWGNAITDCTFDFGDGSTPETVTAASGGVCTAPHAYGETGDYTITLSAKASDGYSEDFTTTVAVDAVSAFTPTLMVDTIGSLEIRVVIVGTDDWSFASCTVNYGDGTVKTSQAEKDAAGCTQTYTYSTAGTYTVTATLTDAGGNQKTLSQSFITGGSGFTALTPQRVLDTRRAIGVTTTTPVAPHNSVKLKIAGIDGLPSTGVTAVALNVTATSPTMTGYIAAYPDGASLPNTSNINFSKGQTVPNTVIVQVGADGYVDLANASGGTTHLVADLEGYYSAAGASGFHPLVQKRLLDTRTTKTPIAAGGHVRLNLGSSYTGITAAVLNATVTDATGSGFITAYPEGGTVPGTSNVNFSAGQTVPNEVIVQVGSDGYVDFANNSTGTVQLVVDISGYFTNGSGAKFVPITPERYLDTRNGTGAVDNYFQSVEEAGPDSLTDLDVGDVGAGPRGTAPVPNTSIALAANVTVTQPTAQGFIGVFPPTSGIQNTSAVNYMPGQTRQNAVTVGTSTTSSFSDFYLYNASKGSTQLIVDVYGYYNE